MGEGLAAIAEPIGIADKIEKKTTWRMVLI